MCADSPCFRLVVIPLFCSDTRRNISLQHCTLLLHCCSLFCLEKIKRGKPTKNSHLLRGFFALHQSGTFPDVWTSSQMFTPVFMGLMGVLMSCSHSSPSSWLVSILCCSHMRFRGRTAVGESLNEGVALE